MVGMKADFKRDPETGKFRTRAMFEAAHREGYARGISAWNRRAVAP